MVEGEFAAAASGLDNHVAVAQDALGETYIELYILDGSERRAPAAFGAERLFVDINNRSRPPSRDKRA
jgi:hypothetical protein